jgi:OmpA family
MNSLRGWGCRPDTQSSLRNPWLAAFVPLLVAMAGCVPATEQGGALIRSSPTVLSQICKISTPAQIYELSSGRATRIRMSNDGSCAFSLFRIPRDGSADGVGVPYDSAEVVDAPKHGSVSFLRTETGTWVEYRPKAGYEGDDRFAFRLAPGRGYYPTEVSISSAVVSNAVPVPVFSEVAVLDRLVASMSSLGYSAWRLNVAGHTDGSGTEKYNERLSERRAVAVRDYVSSRAGIDPRRLNVSGYGMSALADPGRPMSGINRRVNITLVPVIFSLGKGRP